MTPDRVAHEADVMDGRVVLVTGGSRGIGLAAARDLGHRGATVVLVGRDPSRAESAASALCDEGIDAVGFGCDVGDPAQVGRLVEPDEGARTDQETDSIAYDAGAAGGGASAEELAVHETRPPDAH